MKVYYAVIDTNVLVSAMLSRTSAPGEIIRSLLNGKIVPLLHAEILEEYWDVLNRPKFGWSGKMAEGIIREIEALGVYADALLSEEEFPDSDDRIFYEVVMEKRQESDAYLVTGNIKHFPVKPFVVTPRQMLDILECNDDDF